MSDFYFNIEEYILNHSDAEDPVLAELNRETNLKILRPRMLSGHLQGKILEMISKMIRPEKILEIGTYTGYSAICMAKGLKENGILHTIEINDELEEIISRYVEKSGLRDKIMIHFGNALEIIPSLNEMFDLAFIDGDKREYMDYYNLVLGYIKPGGFILADNVLWSGKVVEMESPDDEYTKGIFDFNDFLKNDTRVEKVILPLRDGLTLIRKISE
ncbi:MAG: methyltransferase [Bacteroidetes bacterium GWC2_33_15]|nr:MAG: methyltransferase [Bacteroidetes bacterium GWA2_33_15]OFX50150.1 MAG: methyltransferase [Bacteroidetes bacterium GWC2_33_15]OFX65302.1 MAG: methyltransferase [Bacteroidetes bacterium GWB2_32_14]OFX70529.1 MAG: methyltransferase [Bacteroidetes bacterium GWD2_33_33]HAN19597.1 methyltransferase [Bacteroidales bacterium]